MEYAGIRNILIDASRHGNIECEKKLEKNYSVKDGGKKTDTGKTEFILNIFKIKEASSLPYYFFKTSLLEYSCLTILC